jgi:hypothetical protein
MATGLEDFTGQFQADGIVFNDEDLHGGVMTTN